MKALYVRILVAAWFLLPSPTLAEETPIKVGFEKQLFLDGYLISNMDNVNRVLHQPKKHPQNPILLPEKPWEGRSINPYLVVFDQNEKTWKLWYTGFGVHKSLPGLEDLEKVVGLHGRKGAVVVPGLDIRSRHDGDLNVYAECYAISKDGIHFARPPLGLIAFPGSHEKTNLVPYRPAFRDDHDPDPQRRFKATIGTGDASAGVGIAWSPDGLHWTQHPDNPVMDEPIGGGMIIWDDRIKKYVGYFRPRPFLAYPRRGRIRVVGRSTSPDFIHWTLPQENVVLAPDEKDDPGIEFYRMSVHQYEGCYIGFLWIYHNITSSRNPEPRGWDQTIDCQLAFSRDGRHWIRVSDRQTFMPKGPPGGWDELEVYPTGMINRNNEIWIYYGGSLSGHGYRFSDSRSTLVEGRKVVGGIGLAKLRLDGFVSIRAGEEEGTMTTRIIEFSGQRRLIANASAKGGYVIAEVLDRFGKPLAGYGRHDCVPLEGDFLESEIDWKTGKSLTGLVGKPIRLRFIMKNADLYSFRLTKSIR